MILKYSLEEEISFLQIFLLDNSRSLIRIRSS